MQPMAPGTRGVRPTWLPRLPGAGFCRGRILGWTPGRSSARHPAIRFIRGRLTGAQTDVGLGPAGSQPEHLRIEWEKTSQIIHRRAYSVTRGITIADRWQSIQRCYVGGPRLRWIGSPDPLHRHATASRVSSKPAPPSMGKQWLDCGSRPGRGLPQLSPRRYAYTRWHMVPICKCPQLGCNDLWQCSLCSISSHSQHNESFFHTCCAGCALYLQHRAGYNATDDHRSGSRSRCDERPDWFFCHRYVQRNT